MGEKLVNKIGQKIGAATSGGTLLTGISTYLEILPGLLGVVASLMGIILSVVVMYCTISKNRLERRILRGRVARIEAGLAPSKRGGKKS